MNRQSQSGNMDQMMEEWGNINQQLKDLDTELHNEKDELEKSKSKTTKLHQRQTKVEDLQKDQVVKLLKLMGMPIVNSPSEAEAQCAELSKEDKIWGVASEDMDTLCFGTRRLIRNFNALNQNEAHYGGKTYQPIQCIHLDQVLKDFEMEQKEFVDMCILCGCDYTGTLDKIGPKTAFEWIRK